MRPPYKVPVLSGERYSFIILYITLIVMREVGVAEEFIFSFWYDMEVIWDSKAN